MTGIVYQKWICRDDLVNNRKVLYVFGDNCERKGTGGQAREMRGEPNAVGVRTKKHPSMLEKAFFTDDEYDANVAMIREDMLRADEWRITGGIVVYPADGIGSGLSRMPQRCPETYRFLESLGLGGIHR